MPIETTVFSWDNHELVSVSRRVP